MNRKVRFFVSSTVKGFLSRACLIKYTLLYLYLYPVSKSLGINNIEDTFVNTISVNVKEYA